MCFGLGSPLYLLTNSNLVLNLKKPLKNLKIQLLLKNPCTSINAALRNEDQTDDALDG